jgi:hypothetical protein
MLSEISDASLPDCYALDYDELPAPAGMLYCAAQTLAAAIRKTRKAEPPRAASA